MAAEPGSHRPAILAASACARVRCRARCTRRPYRQASSTAARVAASAAAASGTSKNALRYTTGAQVRPATDRHTAWASRGQPATAAPASSATAAPVQASALPMAVSQAASPGRALMPCPVSRVSTAGTNHATAMA